MLKDKIAAIEKQMLARLEEIRATYSQAGDKGNAAEQSLIGFLRQYLPIKYQIGQGEIVDQENNTSKQTDVVIVNENHPFTFSADEPGLFFIEGVVAAGEVKSVLGSKELNDTIDKSKAFKKLQPKYEKGSKRWGKDSDFPRYYDRRPFFCFAYESDLTNETIVKRLSETEQSEQANKEYIVDAMCILNKAFIVNLADGNGYYQILSNTNNMPFTGWNAGFTDNVLFHLLAWLNSIFPQEFRPHSILPAYFMKM